MTGAPKVYYNDDEPFIVALLKNLIADGQLPPGDVDDRSITEVQASDLAGYNQCHFFAGIGGWAYALRLAGWGDRPVWTGSCPCQPFSAAGKRQAGADARHLWPVWFRLIRESQPERIFGEQVAGAAGLGWLDLVSTDLEAAGYAVGACVLGAHSVGAPHRRQRLYFVADTGGQRHHGEPVRLCGRGSHEAGTEVAGSGATGELGNADNPRSQGWGERGNGSGELPTRSAGLASGFLADSELSSAARLGELGRKSGDQSGAERGGISHWADCLWLPCRDGKVRPVPAQSCVQFMVDGLSGELVPSRNPSDAFPLAQGVPNRVGLLRGAGNAINLFVAAEFIRSYMEAS